MLELLLFALFGLLDNVFVLLIVFANRSGSEFPYPLTDWPGAQKRGKSTRHFSFFVAFDINYTFADWHERLVSSQKIVQLLVIYSYTTLIHDSTVIIYSVNHKLEGWYWCLAGESGANP